jgi:type IV pilus assembly protein PilW
MRRQPAPLASAALRARGFSLIEVLVGLAIGLAGILILMQVYIVADTHQRRTGSGADAQTSGVMAAFALERDLRLAGFGHLGFGCGDVNAYQAGARPAAFTLPARAVTISPDTPRTSGNDQLQIIYSAAPLAPIAATLQNAMPDSSAALRVDTNPDFGAGDFVAIAQPPALCSLLRLTAPSAQLDAPSVTGPGFQWDLPHAPGPFNPPDGTTIFPAGGYAIGAKVINLGALTNRVYYLENERLMMRDALLPTGRNNPIRLASGILALRAQYGLDTNHDGQPDRWSSGPVTDPTHLIAVRFALVARSNQYEKELVTNSPLVLWDNGAGDRPTVALSAAQRHYRYKVYQTIVPLRNVIWGKA